MRTFTQLNVLIAKDNDQRQKLIEQLLTIDDSDANTSKTYQASDITLAADAADVAVAFGGVTKAQTILIVAYQQIEVKLNAGGSPGTQQLFKVSPKAAVETGAVLSEFQTIGQPGILFLRGEVTSIHLGNPSGSSTAEALVVLVGEAP